MPKNASGYEPAFRVVSLFWPVRRIKLTLSSVPRRSSYFYGVQPVAIIVVALATPVVRRAASSSRYRIDASRSHAYACVRMSECIYKYTYAKRGSAERILLSISIAEVQQRRRTALLASESTPTRTTTSKTIIASTLSQRHPREARISNISVIFRYIHSIYTRYPDIIERNWCNSLWEIIA